MKAFGNYHPTVLMTYFLSVLLVVMFVPNPVLQLSALLGACAFSAIISQASGAFGYRLLCPDVFNGSGY